VADREVLVIDGSGRWQVILLPGGVLPAELAYKSLLTELAGHADARIKDLELYAGEHPPADYSLDTEVAGIARLADEAGFDQFHLVGYSGGGASSLAFTSAYPDRVLSLALMEPAWAGNEGLGPEELKLQEALRSLRHGPPQEFMTGFARYHLKLGVEPAPPPTGPSPPWMARRPAGLAVLMSAFDQASLDLERLRRFNRPVYFALGGLSNPDYFARMAERLAKVFPDFTLETFPYRHHFDPPHRTEPGKLAASLQRLWRKAEPHPAP
jgi:pimeloyl-ACP methyl ester carboxylesterase